MVSSYCISHSLQLQLPLNVQKRTGRVNLQIQPLLFTTTGKITIFLLIKQPGKKVCSENDREIPPKSRPLLQLHPHLLTSTHLSGDALNQGSAGKAEHTFSYLPICVGHCTPNTAPLALSSPILCKKVCQARSHSVGLYRKTCLGPSC